MADSSSTNGAAPSKVNRRRAAKDKTRLANSQLEATKKENAKLKDELSAFADGDDPKKKEEYERMKSVFEASGRTLAQVEEELQQAKKEEEDVLMEGLEMEGDDDSLFVPPGLPGQSFGSQSNQPVVDLTDANGHTSQEAIVDDPEDATLFTPAQAREASGETDDGEVKAWKEQGYSTPVIIASGPPNAPKYLRSTAYRAGITFDKEKTPKFGPDHRYGDELQGRKFVRKWAEFQGILGEAYEGSVENLKPRQKGEKRHYPLTELLVKWEINGEVFRVWETRSSIKHLWPNPVQCDNYIYLTAKHHAKIHQDWLDGNRKATSKSPSPGPDTEGLMPRGTPAVTIKKENGSSDPATFNKDQPPMTAMLEYREQWCALEDINPAKMTPEDKANFLLTWNMMKLKL